VYLLAPGLQDRLLPAKAWSFKEGESFTPFETATMDANFDKGVGLPGRVLASGQSAWIKDVTKDPNFARAKMVAEAGIKAGCAVPIFAGKDVIAVMEFFSTKAAEPDTDLLLLLENIGGQLGCVFERKRAEEELRNHRDNLEKTVKERTKELVIAKDRAETANRAKSAFLTSVSHELKTPLNSIIGFSDVLADGSAGPVTEEQKEYLDILHSSGHSLLSLVNNILDLSSMQAGDIKLELNEFDLDLSMTNWIHGMEQEFVNKNISFGMEIEPGIGTVTADEQ
jgi:signal transduction histidine kinase